MSDELEQVLTEETVLAVAQLKDGRVIVQTCVGPGETATWLLSVAQELMDKAEASGSWSEEGT